jgi:hypothetical protein
MKRSVRIGCPRARKAIQEWLDAPGPASAPPTPVAEHLSICRECSEFARILSGLGDGLRSAIDARLATLPAAQLERVWAEAAGPAAEGPAGRPGRPGAASRRRVSRRPAGTTRLHWIAVPAAAVLLAAALFPVVSRRLETRRLLRSEITLFVDELYAEPLLAGVEAGPVDDQSSLELLEEAGAAVEGWLAGEEQPLSD